MDENSVEDKPKEEKKENNEEKPEENQNKEEEIKEENTKLDDKNDKKEENQNKEEEIKEEIIKEENVNNNNNEEQKETNIIEIKEDTTISKDDINNNEENKENKENKEIIKEEITNNKNDNDNITEDIKNKNEQEKTEIKETKIEIIKAENKDEEIKDIPKQEDKEEIIENDDNKNNKGETEKEESEIPQKNNDIINIENKEEKKENMEENKKIELEEQKVDITEQKDDDKIEIKQKQEEILINQLKEPDEKIIKNDNNISNVNEQNQEEKDTSNELEIKEENTIITIETEADVNNKNIQNQNNSENLNLKPKNEKSDFEQHIIQAYKNLTGQNDSEDKNNEKNNIIIPNSENLLTVKNCEKELRHALQSCIETKIIFLNKNMLDKMGRIVRHNKMNLIFIIGQIYINLMLKDYLFNPLNKSINAELLIFFCNEVISLRAILKHTYLGNKFNKVLINFIIKIMKEYKLEKEQLKVMMEILETHNINEKPIKIKAENFEQMVKNINDTLNEQENFYAQYKFIFDNSDIIENMINKSDLNNQEGLKYLNNYLDLGKIFSYLLYNKNFVIYLKQQIQENEIQGISKQMFDGYEDNTNINAIEDEKYFIDIDDDIQLMREYLCKLIIVYVEKYKAIKTLFEFQYLLYTLLRRIYFHFHDKYKDKVDNLLSEIVINLCFFKDETIEEIKIFINEILKSNDEKDSNLKKLINEKIEQNKSNPDFNYKSEESESNIKSETQIDNYFTNMTNVSIESIYITQSDLRIGFFNKKKIKAGEIFTFYVELSKPYGIIDFCLALDDYDIKLRIKNLTEGREVYNENEVTIFHCPLKLTMFFTKPGIFQFELDNGYSWLRSKTVRYKINKFYPMKSYYLYRKIILMKYKEIINKRKQMTKINYNTYQFEKIFLVKFNGENNSFNSSDTTLNIEISNKMGRDNYLKISTIYLNISKQKELSCFYAMDNNEFIKYELNKNNFMKYINENILEKSEVNIDIINLYLITNNENIEDTHYMSIEDILGFEPEINLDELNNKYCKVLFFLQYFHQAQMLYYLFSKINNEEKFQNVILVSYNTYSGYQICIYKNGEIFLKMDDIELKKKETLKTNIALIAKKIKEINPEEKIEILIGENINENDKEMNAEKIGDELIKKLGMSLEEEGNIKVVYLNKEFNNEVNLNSHIFYLNE